MNFHLAALVAFLAPLAIGCAEDEVDGREAAYPVGYTVPRSRDQGSAEQMAVAPNVESPAPGPGPVATSPEGTGAGAGDEYAVGAESEATRAEYPDSDPSALTDFRGALDPYGTWVEDASYGTVWVPSPTVVGAGFTPYVTAGRWAYDDDYVWVSDYEWGWAPFHYGRWVYGGGVGWEWIPGRRYAGAWVSWRWGQNDWSYVGWAPLPPTWCWHRGAPVGIGFVPMAPYAFVSTGELFTPGLHGRVVSGPQVAVIAAHTRPWVPASPSVAAGPAARVVARPEVVGGPPPSLLRIGASSVVHGGLADRGVLQARAFAEPRNTVPFAPSVAVARPTANGPGVTAPYGGGGAVGYAYPSRVAPAQTAGPPHFGGRLGTGFVGSAPARPTYLGSGPRTTTQPAPGAVYGGNYVAPGPVARAPSIAPAPAVRGAYSAPAPVSRGGNSSAPAPAFHGGGAPSAPAFHSGSAAPSFHSSGGFSGGGFSGGGFHGGGGRVGGHR